MEMANAGLIDVLIVDDWKARMWALVLPKVKIDQGLFVREGGRVGWAVRKGNPHLQLAIQDFDANYARRG